MKIKTTLCLLLFYAVQLSFSQTTAVWKIKQNQSIQKSENFDTKTLSANHKFFELDLAILNQMLKEAPNRKNTFASNTVISFPNILGDLEEFKMLEASNFDDALQARFSEIRSYIGVGISDKLAQIRISISPESIQAQIFRTDKKNELIIPFSDNKKIYAVTNTPEISDGPTFECVTIDNFKAIDKKKDANKSVQSSAQVLKTFRLALSCTAEFTTIKGGTIPLVLASINNTLTVVNGILNKEVAVNLVMINNTSLLYTDTITDPYSLPANALSVIAGCTSPTFDCPTTWNNELQTTLTTVVGESNYDIGHLFSTGGKGGHAGCFGCICDALVPSTSNPVYQKGKGSGWSSFNDNSFTNLYYFENYLIPHEVGHQLGAYHTFGHFSGATDANVEPGSGSTIMSYGGVAPFGLNVVTITDDYYSFKSLEQIQTNLATKSCGQNTILTNTPPIINAGADLILPKGTPFFLTGTGTDVNGDAISYSWEQNDDVSFSTNQLSVPSPTKVDGAHFRSLPAVASPVRYFPSLSNLSLTTAGLKWEVPPAPITDKTLNFKLTGRDNALGQVQTNSDAMTATFKVNVGPFLVTSQNIQDQIWIAGATETITWTVNNTTALVGSTTVDILFSTDGGLTFPTILLANTPNDGSEAIIVPNVVAEKCKIMVKPSNNVYFNVNNKSISIGYSVATVCNSYAVNPNFTIPDNVLTSSIITINVPTNEYISDVNLSLNITHPFMGNIGLRLSNPSNNVDNILIQNTCSGINNFNGTLDDAGSAIICVSPIAGLILPTQPLSDFNGGNALGDWKVRIRDTSSTEIGVLNSATLNICSKVYTQIPLTNAVFNIKSFTIFPNPSTGIFNIQTENPITNANITVADLNGRIVHESKAENLDNKSLNLNHLQNGIYILNVSNGDFNHSQKIIKQ